MKLNYFDEAPKASKSEKQQMRVLYELTDISNAIKIDLNGRYRRLFKEGKLTIESFPPEEYVAAVKEGFQNGSITEKCGFWRIHDDQLYSRRNFYASKRKKWRRHTDLDSRESSSGLSKSNVYKNWEIMKSYFHKNGGYDTIEECFFAHTESDELKNSGSFAWSIARIYHIWKRIPEGQNGFKDFESFADWSILNGYTAFTSFKKVIPGETYSQDTCTWDFFTDIERIAHRAKWRSDKVDEFNRHVDHFKRKMYALRHRGPVCDEWYKDYTTFKAWCIENGADKPLSSIARFDKTKPFGPNNCYVK